MIVHTLGDKAKNVIPTVVHVEGAGEKRCGQRSAKIVICIASLAVNYDQRPRDTLVLLIE